MTAKEKKKTPKKITPKKKKVPSKKKSAKNTIIVTLDDFEIKMLEELNGPSKIHLKPEQILKMGLANVYYQFKQPPINIPTIWGTINPEINIKYTYFDGEKWIDYFPFCNIK